MAINRRDGSLKWRLEHPRSYDYISTPGNTRAHTSARTRTRMHACTTESMEPAVLYQFQGPGQITEAVLISSMDGTMYSVDVETSATLWKYQTGLENTTQALAPVVDSYSNIYVADHEKFVAMDGSGSFLWSHNGCNGLGVVSSPAVSREGMIAVACNDTSLQLFCCR